MRIRNPVVAGRFYPDDPSLLKRWISSHRSETLFDDAIGGIVPHAGYVFSGDLACEVISSMKDIDTFVILGPNHTGLGPVFSVSGADAWLTPLGAVEVDGGVREAILDVKGMEKDDTAHLYEHSIEVQLPIIQVFFPEAKVVPITVKGGVDVDFYVGVGKALSNLFFSLSKDQKVAWLVSSDMNHYEDHYTTLEKDAYAIRAIENLDPEELWRVVNEYDISMCGIYPAIVVLSLMRMLDRVEVKPIGHKTSAESSGDYDQVVGYFGCVFLY